MKPADVLIIVVAIAGIGLVTGLVMVINQQKEKVTASAKFNRKIVFHKR